MVIGHHNFGMFKFYTRVFTELGITLNEDLARFLRDRQMGKIWKKDYDADPTSKKRREFTYESEGPEELLRLVAHGPKIGTYQSGFVMKRSQGDEVKTAKKQKKLDLCTCGGKFF